MGKRKRKSIVRIAPSPEFLEAKAAADAVLENSDRAKVLHWSRWKRTESPDAHIPKAGANGGASKQHAGRAKLANPTRWIVIVRSGSNSEPEVRRVTKSYAAMNVTGAFINYSLDSKTGQLEMRDVERWSKNAQRFVKRGTAIENAHRAALRRPSETGHR